jgi:hypothetical protein
MTIKEKLIEKVKLIKNLNYNNKVFDDIRDELTNYNITNFGEFVWNIINDYPSHNCKECNKETKFRSFKYGYTDFCDVKCSNRFKGKNEELNKKISLGVSKFNKSADDEYWNKRTETHRKTLNNQSDKYKEEKRIKKAEIMKNVHANRCEEEKIKLNITISEAVKNSEKAKLQRIKRAKMGAKALNDYRKTLKNDELKEFNKKFGNKGISEEQKPFWAEYYKLVWYYTNIDLSLVDNIELRGIKNGFSLDHIYSIKQGFLDKIDPSIIGSKHNLRIITISENSSKGIKCDISKEELLKLFFEN